MTLSTYKGNIKKVDEAGSDWLATYEFEDGLGPTTEVKELLPKSLWPELKAGMKVAFDAFTPHSTTRDNFTIDGRSPSY